MLRRVVPLNPFEQRPRRGFSKSFDQRLFIMRIQIIHDPMQSVGFGVTLQEVVDEPREVGPLAMSLDAGKPLARLRLDRHEHAARSAPAVLVILLGDLAGRGL